VACVVHRAFRHAGGGPHPQPPFCSCSCGRRRRAVAIVHLGLLKSTNESAHQFPAPEQRSAGQQLHPHQSVAATRNPEALWQGLFHGPQTNLQYVPEQQTDFIFSAVGENSSASWDRSVSFYSRVGVVAAPACRPDIARRLRSSPGRGTASSHRLQRLENAGMAMGIMRGRHTAAVPELRRVGPPWPSLRCGHRSIGCSSGAHDDRYRFLASATIPPDRVSIPPHGGWPWWPGCAWNCPVSTPSPGARGGGALARSWPFRWGWPTATPCLRLGRSLSTPRPLTHALFTDVLERHEVRLEAVRITARRGRSYFAELDTTGPRAARSFPVGHRTPSPSCCRQRMPTPVLVADWVFDPEEQDIETPASGADSADDDAGDGDAAMRNAAVRDAAVSDGASSECPTRQRRVRAGPVAGTQPTQTPGADSRAVQTSPISCHGLATTDAAGGYLARRAARGRV